MIGIVIIALLIAVGAVFLLRSPPAPPAAVMSDADARVLREEVLRRLRERLVGWTFDVPEDKPLELTAIEGATERRIQMNLERLGQYWFPLYSRKEAERANDQIEAFVVGATGQSEGDDQELDVEGLKDALALQLVPAGKAPGAALTRPVGSLLAVLVLRTDRAEPVAPETLESLHLSEDEGFKLAFRNLERDVEEGLPLEPLDDTTPPGAVALAPHDPLAPAYALVPALEPRVKKALGGREARFYVDAASLTAAIDGVELDRERPLLPEGIPLSTLHWPRQG